MNRTKFSMNALLVVVIIFSALAFVFTIVLVDLADRRAVNEYIPIEGTEYAIRYSSLEPNGLYKGPENTCTLVAEGNFGSDWGAFTVGGKLYLNEYTSTDLGVLLCSIVGVEMNTGEKTVLYRDTVLRGRCASGEPVCVRGAMLPADFPETNSLGRLYRLTQKNIASPNGGEVLFLDPQTLSVVYTVPDDNVFSDGFAERYLQKPLAEVER
ncbi:MAG: hypothetical protein IJK89_12590 [Clostridia bacterium]|nr:hypothetical protein [Clostridia bacterium]